MRHNSINELKRLRKTSESFVEILGERSKTKLADTLEGERALKTCSTNRRPANRRGKLKSGIKMALPGNICP